MRKLFAAFALLLLFAACSQPKTTIYITNPEGGVDTMQVAKNQVIRPDTTKGQ